MRAERLLNIMVLLKNREIMTTEKLAEELNVSPRTILRDMDALSLAGIPVYSIRGKHGGWTILESFKNNLFHLKQEEIHSLIASPSGKLLKDLGMKKGTIDIREKLLASLSKSDTVKTRTFWERVYVDTGTWRESNDNTTYLEIVQKAVLENKKLKMVYKKFNNNESETYIEPLGLVAKSNRWYLIARKEKQYRNYRVARILSATILDEVFIRPTNFNLIKYWETSKKDFISRLPQYLVEVEVTSSIINRITFTSKFIHSLEMKQSANEEWTFVKLTFNDKQEAIEYILGFGDQIRIISPKNLKEDILHAAQEVIRLYTS
ncbi:helix-turn-helix transcriptional regulator [Halalkalibacter okhensis]|uniref:Transcriptional regulator n=1 Tax=Halalkalibacter okhensis TaxID=333138 RepID=A0A0B0IGP8_9BACI|nr:YafY family protein [Halalkalibacter okhensis]KHF39239.1 transcriptional regulator [Halalkalibacter okhensis]